MLEVATLSPLTTSARHCAIASSGTPAQSTEVTRHVSAPVMPYVWPVTHDGLASTRMTSLPGCASKHVTMVCVTPDA